MARVIEDKDVTIWETNRIDALRRIGSWLVKRGERMTGPLRSVMENSRKICNNRIKSNSVEPTTHLAHVGAYV